MGSESVITARTGHVLFIDQVIVCRQRLFTKLPIAIITFKCVMGVSRQFVLKDRRQIVSVCR